MNEPERKALEKDSSLRMQPGERAPQSTGSLGPMNLPVICQSKICVRVTSIRSKRRNHLRQIFSM